VAVAVSDDRSNFPAEIVAYLLAAVCVVALILLLVQVENASPTNPLHVCARLEIREMRSSIAGRTGEGRKEAARD